MARTRDNLRQERREADRSAAKYWNDRAAHTKKEREEKLVSGVRRVEGRDSTRLCTTVFTDVSAKKCFPEKRNAVSKAITFGTGAGRGKLDDGEDEAAVAAGARTTAAGELDISDIILDDVDVAADEVSRHHCKPPLPATARKRSGFASKPHLRNKIPLHKLYIPPGTWKLAIDYPETEVPCYSQFNRDKIFRPEIDQLRRHIKENARRIQQAKQEGSQRNEAGERAYAIKRIKVLREGGIAVLAAEARAKHAAAVEKASSSEAVPIERVTGSFDSNTMTKASEDGRVEKRHHTAHRTSGCHSGIQTPETAAVHVPRRPSTARPQLDSTNPFVESARQTPRGPDTSRRPPNSCGSCGRTSQPYQRPASAEPFDVFRALTKQRAASPGMLGPRPLSAASQLFYGNVHTFGDEDQTSHHDASHPRARSTSVSPRRSPRAAATQPSGPAACPQGGLSGSVGDYDEGAKDGKVARSPRLQPHQPKEVPQTSAVHELLHHSCVRSMTAEPRIGSRRDSLQTADGHDGASNSADVEVDVAAAAEEVPLTGRATVSRPPTAPPGTFKTHGARSGSRQDTADLPPTAAALAGRSDSAATGDSNPTYVPVRPKTSMSGKRGDSGIVGGDDGADGAARYGGVDRSAIAKSYAGTSGRPASAPRGKNRHGL